MQTLLTRREVEARCKVSRTTIYRFMRSGLFPEPLRIGVSAVRWSEREIEQRLARRQRATGNGARVA